MISPNIALFGYNNVGIDVAMHLKERNQKFVVADVQPDNLQKAEKEDIHCFSIDLTDDETLISVGLKENIDTIFCLFLEDSKNVFLTISARAINPELNIISIASSEDASNKLIAAGANKVINPYQISGRKIYEIIRKPEIVELLDSVVFGQQDLNMVELVIEAGSKLENTYLKELEIKSHYNLILLGIEDKELGSELMFATSGINHKLDAGDRLVVIGPSKDIQRFQNDYARAI